MQVTQRSPTADPHSGHSPSVAVSSAFTITSSPRAKRSQLGDRTSMNAYSWDHVSSSMNRSPRSRIIVLSSLNTSRGLWKWSTTFWSPRENVASRRPWASSTEISSLAETCIPKLESRWFAWYSRSARSNFSGTVKPSHETTNPVTINWGFSFIFRSNSSRDPNFAATRFLKTSRVASTARPNSTRPLWTSAAMSSGDRFGAGGAGLAAGLTGGFTGVGAGAGAAGFGVGLTSGGFGGGGSSFFSSFFQNL